MEDHSAKKHEDLTISRRAYGYIRIPSSNFARENDLSNVQRRKIEDWVNLHGFSLVSIFTDRCAIDTPYENRTNLSRLVSTIQEGETIILMSLIDLMASPVNFLDLCRDSGHKGFGFVAINEGLDTGTSYGKVVIDSMVKAFMMLQDAEAMREREISYSRNANNEE